MKDKRQLNWDKWIRCGEYRIENIGGRDYIRPVPESNYIPYDVNNLQRRKGSRKPDENNLVHSLLTMDTSNNLAILDFANRFGLLGLLQHKYLEPQLALINGEECYFVPERDGDTLGDVEEISRIYRLDVDEFINDGHYKAKRTMSEPLEEFKEEVSDFQLTARFVKDIKKAEEGISGPLRALLRSSEDLKDDAKKDTSDLIIVAKHITMVRLSYGNRGISRTVGQGEDGKWQIHWTFGSLLSAAYFFLTQDLAGNFWLGECPRCSNLYLSSVGSQVFCSRKCEDATRKANARKKRTEVQTNGR